MPQLATPSWASSPISVHFPERWDQSVVRWTESTAEHRFRDSMPRRHGPVFERALDQIARASNCLTRSLQILAGQRGFVLVEPHAAGGWTFRVGLEREVGGWAVIANPVPPIYVLPDFLGMANASMALEAAASALVGIVEHPMYPTGFNGQTLAGMHRYVDEVDALARDALRTHLGDDVQSAFTLGRRMENQHLTDPTLLDKAIDAQGDFADLETTVFALRARLHDDAATTHIAFRRRYELLTGDYEADAERLAFQGHGRLQGALKSTAAEPAPLSLKQTSEHAQEAPAPTPAGTSLIDTAWQNVAARNETLRRADEASPVT